MNAGNPIGSKEIIELLSLLRAKTPEYPSGEFEARKAAFLKKAAILKIQGTGQGGEWESEA